jgi:hypothetical protein
MHLKDALQMFQELVDYSFPYSHCWCILRREKKWSDWLASLVVEDKKTMFLVTIFLVKRQCQWGGTGPRQVLKNVQWGETEPRN